MGHGVIGRKTLPVTHQNDLLNFEVVCENVFRKDPSLYLSLYLCHSNLKVGRACSSVGGAVPFQHKRTTIWPHNTTAFDCWPVRLCGDKGFCQSDDTARWITWYGGRWRTQQTVSRNVNCRTYEHRALARPSPMSGSGSVLYLSHEFSWALGAREAFWRGVKFGA